MGRVNSRADRQRDDACPGALHVHQAADGALARIRLPGGMINAPQLAALAHAATQHGSGTLELTTRGNIQLRGVTDTDAVADVAAEAGLLPSATHERIRNIVSSPLSGRVGSASGRVGSFADVRPLVGELDRALQSDPDLAALPGRFLFGIDDGRADISGLGADIGVHAVDDRAALVMCGSDTGVRVDRDEAATSLLTVARRFVAARGSAWRISELDRPDALLRGFHVTAADRCDFDPVSRPPVGWIPQDDGKVALGAVVPLGVLSARQAEFLAAIEAPVVITPWRSLLVCDLDEGVADASLRVLAPLGLVFDANSPWLDVSACVGTPGCERSRADVRAEAVRIADDGAAGGRVHYVGCERACGSPPTGAVIVATGDGFTPLRSGPDPRP